jgi:hypothetical protein
LCKLESTEFAMASFLKIDIHFAKYLGSSLKAGNPPTYIVGSFHKLKSTEFAMASFLKIDVHCAKCLGGSLKATNLPPTYLGHSASSKVPNCNGFILQRTPCPRTIIVGSGFQECGIEIPCITLEIVVFCVVSSSHKVTKVMPPQASFVGNSCHLQSSSISYEHPDHHQLLL